MLYAIISDIHSNLHALRAVLRDLDSRGAERVICLGDLVGYGAFPNEVIEETLGIADFVLAGNHDHAAIGNTDITAFNRYAFQAALWTRNTLTAEHREWLAGLPFTHRESDLFFVHASPVDPPAWHYIFSNTDASLAMRSAPTGTVFIGHTHVPNDHHTRNGRMINSGSVGQPRDGDPRAAYTLYDSSSGERRLVRVEYDIQAAGNAILDAGLPRFLAERLEMGR